MPERVGYRLPPSSSREGLNVPPKSRRRQNLNQSRNQLSGSDLNISLNLPTFVEEIVHELRVNWEFLTREGDEYNPVPIALSLFDKMDQQEIQSFEIMLQKIQHAIDYCSQEYFQEFNESIGTYSQVTEDLKKSRAVVAQMQEDLRSSKHLLQSKQSDLLALHFKATQYRGMLSLLDIIEDLRNGPARLDGHLKSKHWLTLVKELVKARELAYRSDLEKIRGLDDIRRELDAFRAVAYESIVEELHNHLYLKSPYTSVLWTRAQVNIEENIAEDSMRAYKKRLLEEGVSEAKEQNPEADSHHYIRVLIESLDVLDRAHEALKTVRRRAPIEVSQFFTRTITDFAQKTAAQANVGATSKPSLTSEFSGSAVAVLEIRNETKWKDLETLRQFMLGLTAKLSVMLGLQQFALQAAEMKGEAMPYELNDIWKCIQSEIKAFLVEHLEDFGGDPTEVFRRRNISVASATGRSGLFKLGQISRTSEIKEFYENASIYAPVTCAKKELLRHKESKKDGIDQSQNQIDASTTWSSLRSSSKRKPVVTPDPDNVSVLFKPTLNLITCFENMNKDSGQEASDFRDFLDEFVLSVFIPKVEERITNHVARYLSGPDGFVLETDGKLLKSSTAITKLVKGLVGTLKNVPFHKAEYARMIETIMSKYLDRCSNKYMNILKSQDGQAASGEIAKDPDFSRLYLSLLEIPEENDDLHERFVEEEHNAERDYFRKNPLNRNDLIVDRRLLLLLGILRRSMKWFGTNTERFKHTGTGSSTIKASDDSILFRSGDSDMDQGLPMTSQDELNFSRGQLVQSSLQVGGSRLELNGQVIPLTTEMEEKFDQMMKGFFTLAERCLYTLRAELHCHVYFFLDLAVREGNYMLDNEATEPDPYVSNLNDNIQALAEAADALEAKEARFVFDGLPSLINNLFVGYARFIRNMNRYGCLKMLRNISSVQQTLANIPHWRSTTTPLLTRSNRYFGLFLRGSDLVVVEGPKLGFRKEELLRLVDLGTKIEDAPSTPFRRRADSRNAPMRRRSYMEGLKKQLDDEIHRIKTTEKDVVAQA